MAVMIKEDSISISILFSVTATLNFMRVKMEVEISREGSVSMSGNGKIQRHLVNDKYSYQ